MKIKDIMHKYDIDSKEFSAWIKESGFPHKSSITGSIEIEDASVESAINGYKAHLEEKSKQAEEKRQREATAAAEAKRSEEEKQKALASMLITSGFTFDGYTITKYSGYISGDDAVSMDRPSHGFWGGVHGDVGSDLLDALSHLRRNALAELKEAAYALGCNAVIGVDFDYLTLDPETVNNQGGVLYLPFLFGVTANGNAVVIQKNN